MTSEKTHRLRTQPEAHGVTPAHSDSGASMDGCAATPDARPIEHWRSVLGGMSPREVLARLLQGDPLDLRRVVATRLDQRAYLFDADRVHLRALAHCARYAVRYRGVPPLETWLAEIVDQALLDLLREDLQAERRGDSPQAEELAAFVDLARPLGLEPAVMRRVCLAHNLLREADRQAFHGLVIAAHSLEDVARAMGISGLEVARRARRGLEAVLVAAGQLQKQKTSEPAQIELESETEATPAGVLLAGACAVAPQNQGQGPQAELQS